MSHDVPVSLFYYSIRIHCDRTIWSNRYEEDSL